MWVRLIKVLPPPPRGGERVVEVVVVERKMGWEWKVVDGRNGEEVG